MDSMLDNQVMKLSCPHCEESLSERINSLNETAVPSCSACVSAVQTYADLLRAELARIDQELADCWDKRDQALCKDWEMLARQRQ